MVTERDAARPPSRKPRTAEGRVAAQVGPKECPPHQFLATSRKSMKVAQPVFKSGDTSWYNQLAVEQELGTGAVLDFPVRITPFPAAPGVPPVAHIPAYMFGVGNNPKYSAYTYQLCTEEGHLFTKKSFDFVKAVGGAALPQEILGQCASWISERQTTYVGGRSHHKVRPVDVDQDGAPDAPPDPRPTKGRPSGKKEEVQPEDPFVPRSGSGSLGSGSACASASASADVVGVVQECIQAGIGELKSLFEGAATRKRAREEDKLQKELAEGREEVGELRAKHSALEADVEAKGKLVTSLQEENQSLRVQLAEREAEVRGWEDRAGRAEGSNDQLLAILKGQSSPASSPAPKSSK